jgi:hypothetical protein
VQIEVVTNLYKTLLQVQQSEAVVRSKLPQVLRDVMAFAKDRWEQVADGQLSPETAALYKQALPKTAAVDDKQLLGSLELTGPFALMLEEGFGRYDLKPILLRSAKAKSGKSRYVDIPFRHMAKDHSKAMPTNVYSDMQKSIKKAEAAGRFTPSGPGRSTGTVRGKNYGTKSKPSHMASIHSAMLANVTITDKSRSATYHTVRRLSEKSAKEHPDSWIHPGFKGVHAAATIQKDVEKMVPRVLAQVLSAGGGNASILSFEER